VKQLSANNIPLCQSACNTCANAPYFASAHGPLPDCYRIFMVWARDLFFHAECNGEMPLCVQRCHVITVSVNDHVKIENAVIDTNRLRHALLVEDCKLRRTSIDRIELTENGYPVDMRKRDFTVNSTALTIATYMLCHLLSPGNHHKLYMDVRFALITPGTAVEPTRTIRDFIVSCLTGIDYVGAIVPWKDTFFMWLKKYRNVVAMPHDLYNVECLSLGSDLICSLENNFSLYPVPDNEPPGASPADSKYMDIVMKNKSIVACRYTVHLWTRILNLVHPQFVRCFMFQGKPVIRLLREDVMRLMRHAIVHLHCAGIVQLRMPVYKILCQNFVQSNIDGDDAGLSLCVRNLLCMLQGRTMARIMPVHSPYVNYAGIGILPAIISRMRGNVWMSARRSYIDDNGLRFRFNGSGRKEQPGFIHRPGDGIPLDSFGTLHIDGFEPACPSIHLSLIAFLLPWKEHIISADAVCVLYESLQRSHTMGVCYKTMGVLSALYSLTTSKREQDYIVINNVKYVEIPKKLPNIVPENYHTVSYIYALLASDEISDDVATDCFRHIIINPNDIPLAGTEGVILHPVTRKYGPFSLRCMQKVYSRELPPHQMNSLYTLSDYDCMEHMEALVFILEMQSYVQSSVTTQSTLEKLQRTFMHKAGIGEALTSSTYRGEIQPANIVRYHRDDKRELKTNTLAYELERGMTQANTLPVVVHTYKAPHDNPASIFHGCDPILQECVFLYPLNLVEIETKASSYKRRREAYEVTPSPEQPSPKKTGSPFLSVPENGFDMDYSEINEWG
jgi:hypothetical protein